MKLEHLLILFVFSFSAMIFASSAFAVSGNWLVCGNTECPGCSSANWDNCVWDGYNQYCPSTCNGGYSGSGSGYGCYDDWDCPWNYYCSGGSCVYSGSGSGSYYGGYYNCGDGYCNSDAGENWNNCPTDCSSSGYGSGACYDDWDCPNGYYCSGGSCVNSNNYDCSYYGNCGYSTCNYDGYCDSWESSSCSDCYYNYNYDCNYYGNCGYNYCNYNNNYCGGTCTGTCSTPTPPTTCNHQNPKVVISPNSQQGTAGSTLTYTVTIGNNDESNCGSSTFSLTPTCPSGWNCYLDTTSLSVAPGSTGSTTLRVTSSNSAGGTNSISATASYSSGSGTGYASYVISGPSQNCNYGLSISPNSGTLTSTGNWYISATDHSSGCTSPITYTVTYTLSGDCDSSSYASPSSFTISQGNTISNIITVRAVMRTNTCTVNLNIQSPTGSTVASGSYSVNPYGNNYYPQNYYPQYYYPSYPTYSMDQPKEIQTATVPCQTPYEGEIPKATVYAQSSVSTPNESIYIILILALLFLLLLFALIAFLRWLMSRDGRRERTYREDITYRDERREKDGKRRNGGKSSRGFICWNQNGRESPEGF